MDHPNILPFFGVDEQMFRPSFCLISPWMDNGNVIKFLEKNPDFDRLKAVLSKISLSSWCYQNFVCRPLI
jgi:hypothetical protein